MNIGKMRIGNCISVPGQWVSGVVISEVLEEGLSDALSDAAVDLAVEDEVIDDQPGVVDRDVPAKCDFTCFGVHLDDADMGSERDARMLLFVGVFDTEAGFHAVR